MNDDTIGKTSKPDPNTDWQRVRSMTDEEVHAAILTDPDAKPTDEAFWKTARVISPAAERPPVVVEKKPLPLMFRSDIHFDPQNDDAIIWGDEGASHFRLTIRRRLLIRKYGLKKYFDAATAEQIIKRHRAIFEKLAQSAYETGATELIIG
jgi:hypothetical protein